jgi:hypothetical protein
MGVVVVVVLGAAEFMGATWGAAEIDEAHDEEATKVRWSDCPGWQSDRQLLFHGRLDRQQRRGPMAVEARLNHPGRRSNHQQRWGLVLEARSDR